MRCIIIFSFVLLVTQATLFAQVDSSYIYPLADKLALQSYISGKYTSLAFVDPLDNEVYGYLPNTHLKLGIGGMWKALAVRMAFGFGFLNGEDKGKTNSFDMQLHYYGRKWIIDFFWQNYMGFYMEYPEKSNHYILRPDMKIRQYGVLVQYVFNYRKFSLSAAFEQDEWQKHSSGSLHAGLGVYYNVLASDSSFLINGSIKTAQRLRSTLVGPNIGYTYTVVLFHHFFITPSLSVGLHLGIEPAGNGKKSKTGLYPGLFPRIAMGYNSERWALCLSLVNNEIASARSEDVILDINTGNILLTFSWRIDFHPKIPGILESIL